MFTDRWIARYLLAERRYDFDGLVRLAAAPRAPPDRTSCPARRRGAQGCRARGLGVGRLRRARAELLTSSTPDASPAAATVLGQHHSRCTMPSSGPRGSRPAAITPPDKCGTDVTIPAALFEEDALDTSPAWPSTTTTGWRRSVRPSTYQQTTRPVASAAGEGPSGTCRRRPRGDVSEPPGSRPSSSPVPVTKRNPTGPTRDGTSRSSSTRRPRSVRSPRPGLTVRISASSSTAGDALKAHWPMNEAAAEREPTNRPGPRPAADVRVVPRALRGQGDHARPPGAALATTRARPWDEFRQLRRADGRAVQTGWRRPRGAGIERRQGPVRRDRVGPAAHLRRARLSVRLCLKHHTRCRQGSRPSIDVRPSSQASRRAAAREGRRRQAGQAHRPAGVPAHLHPAQLLAHVLGRPVRRLVAEPEVDAVDLDLPPAHERQVGDRDLAPGRLPAAAVPARRAPTTLLEPLRSCVGRRRPARRPAGRSRPRSRRRGRRRRPRSGRRPRRARRPQHPRRCCRRCGRGG